MRTYDSEDSEDKQRALVGIHVITSKSIMLHCQSTGTGVECHSTLARHCHDSWLSYPPPGWS